MSVTHHDTWNCTGSQRHGGSSPPVRRHGTILVGDQVEVTPLVHRGSPVTRVAESSTIEVARKGTALTAARLGEVVRVRVDRRTIIAAVVVGPGLCRVNL